MTVYVRDAPPDHLVRIYLEDHLTGATAGRELARRTLRSNRGTPYEAELRTLAREIDGEIEDLRRVIAHRGGRWTVVPAVKIVAALAAERLGRLKLNGQLRGYSPLSRLVELEGLTAAVQGKRSLWRSLQTLVGSDALPEGLELGRLIEQATAQLTALTELHDRAAMEAFQPA
ncbi:MAG: hypothetical protein JJT89_08155 [Nitriliruptoraceae bacterium]|nr:hypothetical protein [Nitriliruptoraceae bacterium]